MTSDTGVDTGIPVGDGGPRDGGRDGGGLDGGGLDGGPDSGLDGGPGDGGVCTDGRALCTTAGTSCTGDTLVTCALDVDGCLVETSTDCTTTVDNVCQVSGGVAACVDRCAHVPVADRCTAASRACTGDTLDVCAMDAMGCFAMTHTDCTASAGGLCDDSGTMPVCVSTADPCGGLPTCGTATSRSCTDTTHLDVCDANATGCFVDMITTCPTGTVCDDTSGTAACVDPCTLVTTCPSASYCDVNDVVTCAPDANGCLVETARSACTTGPCSAGACTDACPPATGHVIDCTSGTVTGDTSTGTMTINGYTCGGTATSYVGHEVVYRFSNPRAARVHIVSTRDAATGDYDLMVLNGGTGTTVCDGATACSTSSRGVSATETVTFDVQPGDVRWVAYDLYSTVGTDTTTFSLAITCVEPTCGDGLVEGPETCDDGNTAAGDGCSSSCVIETGSVCFGMPSTCGPALTCGNGVTETGETCDDHNTTAGDGCSATCAIETGYGCTGTPSVCTVLCGNGVINSGETCDDGGTAAGDGCSASCAVESGYNCSGAPSVCVAIAANATCAGATVVTGTTTLTGQNTRAGGAAPTGTTCGTAGSGTLYYAVTIPAFTGVTVVVTPTGFDPVIKTEDACGAAACNARVDVGFSGDPETTTISNATASPVTRIVAVNSFNTTQGLFDVSFTYVAANCGNGTIDAGETCDDSNATAGDGCSATCTIETGYNCSGTPSVCIAQAPNATCGSATAVTGTTTFTGENSRAGGPSPTGTTCGTTGGPTLYYALTIPAFTRVTVVGTPTAFDIVLKTEDTCGAAACNARVNSGGSGTAETTTISNATAAPVTRIVAANGLTTGTGGLFDISFTYVTAVCGNGTVDLGETCDDGGTAAGDGCSSTCAVESGYSCFGAPSTCLPIPPNASCSGAASLGSSGTAMGDLRVGGPHATGTGCTSASGPVLWYSVDVPANSATTIVATPMGTPSWDVVISAVASCGATGCTATADAGSSGSETLRLTNLTGSPVTRIFSVGSYGATTYAQFTVTASSAPLPFTPIAAACVDMSAATILPGAGGDDVVSAIAALPFAFTFFGVAEMGYAVNSNGLLELFPALTGTTSNAWSNATIPTATTPNGFITAFWDDVTGGEQRVLVSGAPGSQVMVVQWTGHLTSDANAALRYQAMLFEGTNAIQFHYCSMGTTGTGTTFSGSSATIGTENAAGTAGVLVSYNTSGAATTGTGYSIP